MFHNISAIQSGTLHISPYTLGELAGQLANYCSGDKGYPGWNTAECKFNEGSIYTTSRDGFTKVVNGMTTPLRRREARETGSAS